MRCLKTDSPFSIARKIAPHLKSFGINKCRKTEKHAVCVACLYVTPDLHNYRKKFTDEIVNTVLKPDTGQKYKTLNFLGNVHTKQFLLWSNKLLICYNERDTMRK